MRKFGFLLVFLGGTLFLCQAVLAEDQPAAEKPVAKKKATKPKLSGEYAIMGGVLKLDNETAAKIAELSKANMQAVKDWKTTKGAKLAELRKALANARKAKDEKKIEELNKEIKALGEGEEKLQAEGMAKIMALLTDEQKAVWKGFCLRREITKRFKGMKFTDEQTAQMQKLCEEAAKTMPAADGDEAAKARQEACGKVVDEISQKVLTDAQREEMKKKSGEGAKAKVAPKAKAKAGQKAKAQAEKPAEQPKGD
jgi:Spy/CpxP family protein refolding chaperone